MDHKYDFWWDSIKTLEVCNLVDFLYMMDVEFEDAQSLVRDLFVFDDDPVIFIGLC